ncbi:hypothetical protein KIW84_012245 [Lathyrus oleraceus]|uniref:Pectinesterase inhibitor domain-containing protein n=1 Tax=Pisum sativum TaxID=3888 RepID=A0A9D5BH16_PEA|nr:hypothetical protein KIW84_012245 [Pisum sativum]
MNQSLSLLLVLLVLCVTSSNSISNKVVEVNVICKETSNPLYCSNLLNSKPGGAKDASLVDLAYYTIDVLSDNSNNTNMLISKLIDEIGDNDTEINYYYRCKVNLLSDDGIIPRLVIADKYLAFKQYPALTKLIGGVMNKIVECRDSLHQHKTSPLVAQNVDVLRQIGQVIQILLKYINLG